jgi:DNA-binding transcriptional regulator YiaG
MSIRYQGADLRNVHLENGYTIRRLPDGDEAISIKDVEGLHRAIAEALVDQPTPSDGSRFRFLRKHLKLTQRAAGEKLGVEEQTVSLWERNQLKVPLDADVIMRALVEEAIRGSVAISEILARLNTPDQASHGERLVFAFSEGLGWHLDAGLGRHVPRTTSQSLMRSERLHMPPVEGANWYAVFGERHFGNTFPLTNATDVTTAEAVYA